MLGSPSFDGIVLKSFGVLRSLVAQEGLLRIDDGHLATLESYVVQPWSATRFLASSWKDLVQRRASALLVSLGIPMPEAPFQKITCEGFRPTRPMVACVHGVELWPFRYPEGEFGKEWLSIVLAQHRLLQCRSFGGGKRVMV